MAASGRMVEFKEALHQSQTISGTYPIIRGPYQKAGQKRDCMFKIFKDGSATRVHAYNHDFRIIDTGQAQNDEESSSFDEMDETHLEVLRKDIRRRFRVLDKIATGVIHGKIRSAIVSGAPGIGKTKTLLDKLELALKNGEIKKLTKISGRMSGIALFAQLFYHQDKGEILWLDDVKVFDEEDTLDVFKAATDTTGNRHLHWSTASKWLEEQGVANDFFFNGCVVFVTNNDLDRIIESGSSLAPHVLAVIDRGIYLDVGIHTKLEVMLRIEMVIQETTLAKELGLNDDQSTMIMDWLWDNFKRMRTLSIRSFGKVAEFILSDPDDWKDVIEVTEMRKLRS